MFFTRISEIKRKKSESYIGFDKSTSTLEERLQARLRRLSPYPFGSVEKGLERETLLPFPRLRGSGTHYETGPGFLLLFSIKSKDGTPCFAVKVLNGRMTNVVQPPLSLYLDYSIKPAPHFLRLSYNSPSPFGCKIPLGLL